MYCRTCTSRSNVVRCNVTRCIVDDVLSLEVLSPDVLSGYRTTVLACHATGRSCAMSIIIDPPSFILLLAPAAVAFAAALIAGRPISDRGLDESIFRHHSPARPRRHLFGIDIATAIGIIIRGRYLNGIDSDRPSERASAGWLATLSERASQRVPQPAQRCATNYD